MSLLDIYSVFLVPPSPNAVYQLGFIFAMAILTRNIGNMLLYEVSGGSELGS